jgi:hypothetical protein
MKWVAMISIDYTETQLTDEEELRFYQEREREEKDQEKQRTFKHAHFVQGMI